EGEAVLLSYYRNNIIHLVAVPSLLASFLQHNDRIDRDALVIGAAQLYPFLKEEFFLPWDLGKARKVIENTLDALIGQGFFIEEAGEIRRPDFHEPDFLCTKFLGRTLGQIFERYSIILALLARHGKKGFVEREDFEAQCRLMAQRIALLNGSKDPEFFDKSAFRSFIDRLEVLGYVRAEEGRLEIKERVLEFSESSLELLSTDIRQSISRVAT